MDAKTIKEKFGDNYIADDRTFIMGIDHRITSHHAERFKGFTILETCTGAGFTTILLARVARYVYTVEIDSDRQNQAVQNIEKAGFSNRVSFICGDNLDSHLHECELLFSGSRHELYCLYFGELRRSIGETNYHVP